MEDNTTHKARQYDTLRDYLDGNQNIQPYLHNIIRARDEFCDGDTRTLVKILASALHDTSFASKSQRAIERDSQTAELLLLYETQATNPQRAVVNGEDVIAQDVPARTGVSQTTNATTTSDGGAPSAPVPSPTEQRP